MQHYSKEPHTRAQALERVQETSCFGYSDYGDDPSKYILQSFPPLFCEHRMLLAAALLACHQLLAAQLQPKDLQQAAANMPIYQAVHYHIYIYI